MNHYDVLDQVVTFDDETLDDWDSLDDLVADEDRDDDDHDDGGFNFEAVMGSLGWDTDPEL